MEKDIYEMYINGPFDWFNPVDFATDILTAGPSGSWGSKAHNERIYVISQQYPNLSLSDIEEIVYRHKKLRT